MIDTLLLLSDGFFKWEDGFHTMTAACSAPGAFWLAGSANGTIPQNAKGVRLPSPCAQTPDVCGFLISSGNETLTVLSCLPDEKTFLPFAQKQFPEKRILPHTDFRENPVISREEKVMPAEQQDVAGPVERTSGPVERAPKPVERAPEAIPETFWDCNAEDLTRLLEENPPEEAMNELIPGSRWVRVSENGVSFLAGVIYENENEPLYLCYGFDRPWSETPPEDLEGYSQWIPRDFSEPHGEGYWVIYTDAKTGARVR